MTAQIKSRKRVVNHGEVFTSEREVNAMLDLVKNETMRIESRFLEPACGNGNFLVEILRRKLTVVKSKYRRSTYDYELFSMQAVASIYGVELLQDNVDECIERLFKIWNKEYTTICKKEANDECRDAVRYILKHNILCGDALSLKASNGKAIVFAEWSFIGPNIKRRDFEYEEMIETAESKETLINKGIKTPEKKVVFIDVPIKVYPLVHYRRVQYAE
jgi:hypothetical protein